MKFRFSYFLLSHQDKKFSWVSVLVLIWKAKFGEADVFIYLLKHQEANQQVAILDKRLQLT